jgi:hypothetical protein
MTAVDRRCMLRSILSGVAMATVGLAMFPKVAESKPLDLGMPDALKAEALVEKDQVVVPPVRRPLRRVCWWRGGRRVCGWRWRLRR